LAWIRTGLALMGFGFVLARFSFFLGELAAMRQVTPPPTPGLSLWFGTFLVILGVVVTLLAAGQHWGAVQRINRGDPYLPPRWSLAMAVALVLPVLGIAMAAHMIVMGQ
jgi:putative membrane protein